MRKPLGIQFETLNLSTHSSPTREYCGALLLGRHARAPGNAELGITPNWWMDAYRLYI